MEASRLFVCRYNRILETNYLNQLLYLCCGTHLFAQTTDSKKAISEVVKLLKVWEGENREVARNGHYASLKKIIQQYERAIGNVKS